MNKIDILCDYGCGKPAVYHFKNGKACCSKNINSCTEIKKKIKGKSYVEIYGEEKAKALIEKRRIAIIGDKNPAKRDDIRKINSQKNKGKKSWCKGLTRFNNNSLMELSKKLKGKPKSINHIEKLRKANKGRKSWNKGLRKETNKSLELISKKLSGRERPDIREYMLNGGSIKANLAPRDQEKLKLKNEKTRKRMLEWQALMMLSKVKNPSKPQVELFNIVKELYSTAILNYPLYELNYSLDIAIPDLKIWIESDGSYWHQDKDKDLERQRKIENLGWKCIRYVCDNVNEIPTKEKIKIDIKNIISEDQAIQVIKGE